MKKKLNNFKNMINTIIEREMEKFDDDFTSFNLAPTIDMITYHKIKLFLRSSLETVRKETTKQIQIEVLRLDNPYPQDIFISEKGKASWWGFDLCRKKVLDILDYLSRLKKQEKK
jgi:hypothetical protein